MVYVKSLFSTFVFVFFMSFFVVPIETVSASADKAENTKSPFYWINSYGRGVGTIPLPKKQYGGGAGYAPKGKYYDRGTGRIPAYASYGRGAGTPLIYKSHTRNSKTASKGCSGDYPKHIGARCFKQDTCSKRKNNKYKFDGVTTCKRKKFATNGTPATYPAPSKSEKWSCPGGYSDMTLGVCYQDCGNGYDKSGLACYSHQNGSCPSDKNKVGALCYSKCRDGYHANGLFCYADQKEVCHHGEELDEGLCYNKCRDGYKGRATGCTATIKNQCPSDREFDGGLCYAKCKDGYKRTGAICYQQGSECSAGEENQAGLCYKDCRSGYKGVGPVCWGRTPSNYLSCGAGFAKNTSTCVLVTADMAMAGTLAASYVAGQIAAAQKARETRIAAEAAKIQAKTGQVPYDFVIGADGAEKVITTASSIASLLGKASIDAAKTGKITLKYADLVRLAKAVVRPAKKLADVGLFSYAGYLSISKIVSDETKNTLTKEDEYFVTREIFSFLGMITGIYDLSCTFSTPTKRATMGCTTLEPISGAAGVLFDILAAYTYPVYSPE